MDELYSCTECEYTSRIASDFQEHIEKHESENIPSFSTSSLMTSSALNKRDSKGRFSCPHCSFTTLQQQHMKNHLNSHERHQGQMIACDICHMQFGYSANMQRHRLRHTDVRRFECRVCKKRFYRKDQMVEHLMTHLAGPNAFECPLCDEKFSQHSLVKRHLAKLHKICHLDFTNPRGLHSHFWLKHVEEKVSLVEYETPAKRRKLSDGILDLTFSEPHSSQPPPPLRKSEKPPSPVKEVKKEIEESPNPVKQVKEETIEECHHCGLKFNDVTMFILHNILHTENDPFKCALCGFQCGERYMFAAHMICADHSNCGVPK